MRIALPCRYVESEESGIVFKRYYSSAEFKDISTKTGITFIPVLNEDTIDDIISICDGLLVPGSVIDIDPAHYGQESLYSNLSSFDVFKMDNACIDAFRKADKKILGICAGIQSINVYFGGSLHQDIPGHSLAPDKRHMIMIKRDSKLYGMYGCDTLLVNSLHHQAIDTLGKGLYAGAVSEDGIIEEVETENIMGLQWHPEMMDDFDFIASFFGSNT